MSAQILARGRSLIAPAPPVDPRQITIFDLGGVG